MIWRKVFSAIRSCAMATASTGGRTRQRAGQPLEGRGGNVLELGGDRAQVAASSLRARRSS